MDSPAIRKRRPHFTLAPAISSAPASLSVRAGHGCYASLLQSCACLTFREGPDGSQGDNGYRGVTSRQRARDDQFILLATDPLRGDAYRRRCKHGLVYTSISRQAARSLQLRVAVRDAGSGLMASSVSTSKFRQTRSPHLSGIILKGTNPPVATLMKVVGGSAQHHSQWRQNLARVDEIHRLIRLASACFRA